MDCELSRSATQSRAAPGSRPRPAPQPADASSSRPAVRDDERAVDVVDCTHTHTRHTYVLLALMDLTALAAALTRDARGGARAPSAGLSFAFGG